MSALPITETNPAVERVLDKVGDVAVLPQVVFKIMELTGSEESSASFLEKAIIVDPGFSAKILTQANSAFYALPRKVTSVREAVMFLGFKAVRQLAMAVGVFDMFVGKNDRESLRRRGWWRHSLDSAVCAREIAARSNVVPPDEGYTAGLLHLTGKTLLCRYDSSEYDKVDFLIQNGVRDVFAERHVFGCDHVEVTVWAAARWQFPPRLISGLDYLGDSPTDPEIAQLQAVTAIGDWMARVVKDGQGKGEPDPAPQWALDALGLGLLGREALVEDATRAIADAARLY